MDNDSTIQKSSSVPELGRKGVLEWVKALKKQYKPDLRGDDANEDVFRVMRLYRRGGRVVDLGGGISPHNGVLAQLGMSVYVIDMLGDYWENRATAPASISREIDSLEACGVQFIKDEVSTCDLREYFAENSVDLVTSFHCIEHLHRSPRFVLESALRVLKPGGALVIEVPNAANVRKRLALLCGLTNYGSYNSLYYSEPFLGHVREYTTGDLRQLASNLGAMAYSLTGRNSIYGNWVDRWPSPIRVVLDRGLRLFPCLCSSVLLELS